MAYQPHALKSGGGYARLANNYTQRQPQVLHERLRLAFLFSPPANLEMNYLLRLSLRAAGEAIST